LRGYEDDFLEGSVNLDDLNFQGIQTSMTMVRCNTYGATQKRTAGDVPWDKLTSDRGSLLEANLKLLKH